MPSDAWSAAGHTTIGGHHIVQDIKRMHEECQRDVSRINKTFSPTDKTLCCQIWLAGESHLVSLQMNSTKSSWSRGNKLAVLWLIFGSSKIPWHCVKRVPTASCCVLALCAVSQGPRNKGRMTRCAQRSCQQIVGCPKVEHTQRN